MSPNTLIRSASLAKQFTALGILSLVEKDIINLHDSVFDYISLKAFKNVTIEQLISHTSGIQSSELGLEKALDSTGYLSNEDVISWYTHNENSYFPPGTKFMYNNGAYYALAKIIEEVSGMEFSQYMKTIVFDKAGMANTRFIEASDLSQKLGNMAHFYDLDNSGKWQQVGQYNGDLLIGAGGILTNTNDFFNYIDALRNCKILKPETQKLVFQPLSKNIRLHSQFFDYLKSKNPPLAQVFQRRLLRWRDLCLCRPLPSS